MNFNYTLFYLFYNFFVIILGTIWLKNTNCPNGNSTRFVHHYQVGLACLLSCIPLGIMLIHTSDDLCVFVILHYLVLGIFSIVIDFKDFHLFLKPNIRYLLRLDRKK